MIGKRFGRLFVLARSAQDGAGRYKWRCRCDCGIERDFRGDVLRRGLTVSCGCFGREQNRIKGIKHGSCVAGADNGDATYVSWKSMKQRCYDAKKQSYRYYGGLGITVCEAWRNSFAAFLADMGPRPEGTTLDRIDPFGNYEPSNCRWADAETQNSNQRRHHERPARLGA